MIPAPEEEKPPQGGRARQACARAGYRCVDFDDPLGCPMHQDQWQVERRFGGIKIEGKKLIRGACDLSSPINEGLR